MMMKLQAVVVPLLALAACTDGVAPLDGARQAIVGGVADANEYPAVCGIEVTPPPTDEGQLRAPFFCTGTLVGEAIVLTSARCLVDPETDEPFAASVIDVAFGASFDAESAIGVVDVETYRYFDGGLGSIHEIALVQLASPPAGVSPVEVNAEPVSTDLGVVTLVGYGALQAGQEALKQRYKLADVPVTNVSPRNLGLGTAAESTTCRGDSGGPVFAMIGGREKLVAMTEAQSDCEASVTRIRADVYAADFIHAYLDREEGACASDGACVTDGCRTPDPDCDDSGCAWDGDEGDADCVEACPTRDWDCPLGVFVGDGCAGDGECENGGRCVAAADDATFTYCTQTCADDEGCPTERGMTCADDGAGGSECQHGVPSEGSQGYACSSGVQCRSSICEDRICVTECDPGGDACPDPFVCGPSDESPGTDVCLGEDFDGGGGFCAVGGDRGATASWLLLVLLGVALRRRTPRDR